MKKISLFLLLLLITNCDNGYKKELDLIDLVPTNPILLVKYKSTKEIDVKKGFWNDTEADIAISDNKNIYI